MADQVNRDGPEKQVPGTSGQKEGQNQVDGAAIFVPANAGKTNDFQLQGTVGVVQTDGSVEQVRVKNREEVLRDQLEQWKKMAIQSQIDLAQAQHAQTVQQQNLLQQAQQQQQQHAVQQQQQVPHAGLQGVGAPVDGQAPPAPQAPQGPQLQHVQQQAQQPQQFVLLDTGSFSALSAKIDSLTTVVQETQNCQASFSKRFKPDQEFRLKGNKVQHGFNTEVLLLLDEVSAQIKLGNIAKIKEFVGQAISMLEKRNKLILLADSTDCGWDTVSAYEKHALAEDEADEKRIRKAIQYAQAEKKKSAVGRGRGRGRGGARMPAPAALGAPPATQQPFQQGGGAMPVPPVFPGPPGAVSPRPPVICYNCRNWGHIKPNCPYPKNNSPSAGTGSK